MRRYREMRTLKKRLALFLSSLMLVSVLPTSAWAEEAAVGTAVGEDMSSGVQTSEEMLPTYMSLLPLEETRLKLDLTHFLPGELESVSVQYILDHTTQYSSTSPIPVEEGDTIVWAKEGDDNFQFVGVDDVIDLSSENEYDSQISLTLIVGNGDQLDASNQRYEITVRLPPSAKCSPPRPSLKRARSLRSMIPMSIPRAGRISCRWVWIPTGGRTAI